MAWRSPVTAVSVRIGGSRTSPLKNWCTDVRTPCAHGRPGLNARCCSCRINDRQRNSGYHAPSNAASMMICERRCQPSACRVYPAGCGVCQRVANNMSINMRRCMRCISARSALALSATGCSSSVRCSLGTAPPVCPPAASRAPLLSDPGGSMSAARGSPRSRATAPVSAALRSAAAAVEGAALANAASVDASAG